MGTRKENLELRLRRVNEALQHPRSKASKLVLVDLKAKLEKQLEDECSSQSVICSSRH